MKHIKDLNIEQLKKYLDLKGFGNIDTLFLLYIFLVLQVSEKKKQINVIEFGVYFGRIAKLIYDEVEKLDNYEIDLIDIAERGLMRDLFKQCQKIEFFEMKSEEFVIKKNKKKYDFCHLDSNHHYDTLLLELNFIREHSNKDTIIVVDDFNYSCPQVMKACFDFCNNSKKLFSFFKSKEEFEICLIGFNKAYIVNKKKFSFYEKFILNELQGIYNNNGIYTRLGRSELKKLRCFTIKKTTPNEPSRYAADGHLKDFYNLT